MIAVSPRGGGDSWLITVLVAGWKKEKHGRKRHRNVCKGFVEAEARE